jgi:hypothetical protein
MEEGRKTKALGCSSVVEHLLSMHKDPALQKKKKMVFHILFLLSFENLLCVLCFGQFHPATFHMVTQALSILSRFPVPTRVIAEFTWSLYGIFVKDTHKLSKHCRQAPGSKNFLVSDHPAPYQYFKMGSSPESCTRQWEVDAG